MVCCSRRKRISNHLELLKHILDEVIESQAQLVDAKAVFPEKAIKALGESGLLGLLSSTEVGGLGQGPGAAVIEAHGRLDERKKTASGAKVASSSSDLR